MISWVSSTKGSVSLFEIFFCSDVRFSDRDANQEDIEMNLAIYKRILLPPRVYE